MPSRAARWISAIAFRSKVADSRKPGCQPSRIEVPISVAPEVVGVEVVQLPSRAVTAKGHRVGILDPGSVQQSAELLEMFVEHLLLDAIRTETGHRAQDVQERLVEGIPE